MDLLCCMYMHAAPSHTMRLSETSVATIEASSAYNVHSHLQCHLSAYVLYAHKHVNPIESTRVNDFLLVQVHGGCNEEVRIMCLAGYIILVVSGEFSLRMELVNPRGTLRHRPTAPALLSV